MGSDRNIFDRLEYGCFVVGLLLFVGIALIIEIGPVYMFLKWLFGKL